MPAVDLKGINVVKSMSAGLSERAGGLASSFAQPALTIIRVGDKPDDAAYIRGASKRCESVGVSCTVRAFELGVSNDEFLDEFGKTNKDSAVHGILVMSPLPEGIDGGAVKAMIDPAKDVDCISPSNAAKLFTVDASGHAPCTAAAVMEMLWFYGIPLSGSRVVVVGRSLVVGKPLAMLLLAENATVTICHTRTVDLAGECRRADVLVAATGKPKMLGADHVKPGATVIDVGINVGEDGAICGDVDYEAVHDIAGHITPVPGGVGTVTTAILARNVINACEMLKERG